MILLNGVPVEFETFPNEETRLVHKAMFVQSHNKVVFKYENDSDLIKLMFVKNYLDSRNVKEIHLIIAYMPYSRMDRSENQSPFTLKYVSNFINSLNFSFVTILEPHSDVTTALLDRSAAKYINFDLLPKVMREIDFKPDLDYIFFPDAGAAKRYHDLKGFKQLVGHKNRDFETGEIKSLEVVGELPTGSISRVLIVDDLSSYGGTFVHSAKALKRRGFERVYLLVAHAENSIFKGQLFDNVDKVFTTNSILTEQNNWGNKKFMPQLKIYDIRGVI